jgi:hypothetical protein
VLASRSLIAKLDDAYAGYLRTLGALGSELQQLLPVTSCFGARLDEHRLWISSNALWTPRALDAGWSGLTSVLGQAVIERTSATAISALREKALSWLAWIAALVIAVRAVRTPRELVAGQCEVVATWQIVGLRAAGMELLLTAAAGLSVPLLYLLVANLLSADAGAPDVVFAPA